MDPRIRGIGMTSQRTRQRLVERLRAAGIANEAVLEVIARTPRHLFVDEALESRAYEDTALPIGHGQTISQPFVVARMTEALLAAGTPARVLEIGTGSGYQAAVLAQLVREVYTVEVVQPLLERARSCFRTMGLRNIRSRLGDGHRGWPEHAPYDGILLTAAPRQVPDAVLEQLDVGGRLIAPVGGPGVQTLTLIERHEDGLERQVLDHVSFVPLTGGGE